MKIWRYVPAAIGVAILLAYYLWPQRGDEVVAQYSADNPISSYDFVSAYEADSDKSDTGGPGAARERPELLDG